MPDPASNQIPPPVEPTRRRAAQDERFELLTHLQAILEPLMTALGLLFLVLLLLDYSPADLSDRQHRWLDRALQAIWVAFLVDFAVRFVVAPAKVAFLRANWLTVLSLALPFLRPLRALRAARALRSLSLVRLIGGLNRGMRVLRRVTRGRQFAYVGALTIVMTVAGAVGVLSFDRGVEGAPIQTFGDALWWSSAMVTTINNELYAVSAEARVIAILLRVFAVSVFGFITASIASYFIGRDAEERERPPAPASPTDLAAVAAELSALREEIALLRRQLRETPVPPAAGADDRPLADGRSGTALE